MNVYSEMDQGAHVYDGVWIGSLNTAQNKEWLLSNGIDCIVNMSGQQYPSPLPVLNINMCDAKIDMHNVDYYVDEFAKGLNAIRKYRADNKRVLVHCRAGVNRSAAQIAVWILEQGFSYDEAVHMLMNANEQRDCHTLTNPSFRMMLKMRCVFRRWDKKSTQLIFNFS